MDDLYHGRAAERRLGCLLPSGKLELRIGDSVIEAEGKYFSSRIIGGPQERKGSPKSQLSPPPHHEFNTHFFEGVDESQNQVTAIFCDNTHTNGRYVGVVYQQRETAHLIVHAQYLDGIPTRDSTNMLLTVLNAAKLRDIRKDETENNVRYFVTQNISDLPLLRDILYEAARIQQEGQRARTFKANL